ncbi:metallophosphoesterase family protein [Novosphingobium mangrovi (ex Huang et al. 2023)]|uniref:Metallophosphoesterase n=1 Tax=Novosphingobium mangrovi (ex Huang et al. 2023) TaxID=2976432 RepID=A0ABT2I9V1_9SPHN|nr:metallophosphoesterase [Novosphingobium mangrovi (ex Huang et al. 2023)]MCT2401277.1 metallophosphoesterase [Novosphingobium mangrovi (ex Huang et al. 2023)]
MHGKVSSGRRSPIRLFHLSDIHFGLEDRRALDWAEACIARERPDAVAITGDLTMRARHGEFRAACEWITGLDVPVTVEIGNHDMPYFNLFERFFAPFRRFRAIKRMVDAEIDLERLAIVPLQTATRAQWQRFPWSNGWVTDRALADCLAAIDAHPKDTRILVAAHHPLTERRERDGKLLTINGTKAMEALAGRQVMAVLSGHIHDPFDLTADTAAGPLRMIGAGTLSRRIRSTPPSFNEIVIDGDVLRVEARNLDQVPTPEMQIPDVPENAMPPRGTGEPVSPVGAVPPVDPPVH